MALSAAVLTALRDAVGAEQVLTDAAACWPYGYDNSRRHAPPGAVCFATSHEAVVGVLRTCHAHRIPLVARGRGTGTTGATVPLDHAIVLSLERMQRIVRVDPDNRAMVVEPGVLNQQVQEAAAAHGFFWPPDPTSSAYCTIGGNLAYNSAGPRAVKYGTPRENTLALRAVTGSGMELRCGAYTTKGVVGYDLTRLLIGSEGTLAVITEATLKLTPLPQAKRVLRAVYADMRSAAAAVSRIMAQPVIPCALEFIDGAAITAIRNYAQCDLPATAGALLMIEIDGLQENLDALTQPVEHAAQGAGLLEFRAARDAQESAALWAARKALSPALRTLAPKKINEDIVVPVAAMAELVEGLAELSARFGVKIVNFGHAGNGNIHVNLLTHPEQMDAAHECLACVFALVLRLNGTLSGEHGVGLEKRPYVAQELDAQSLRLMRDIKGVFDPHNILNPGKTLPE